jgi:hypothetical protein
MPMLFSVLASLLRKPNFHAETQRNLRDQKLDTTDRRLSYCLCNERTSGNGDSYVCVGRGVESN